jgi:probable 2-oxoglutarate dehydrogenase E1 component DHKTD1
VIPRFGAFYLNKMPIAGIRNIVLGMPHRGRLNFLTDLLCYPPTALFHKIKGGAEIPDGLGAEGDVISHLGTLLVNNYANFTNITNTGVSHVNHIAV